MGTLFSVVWFSCAIGGMLSALGAFAFPVMRQRLFVGAAALFGIAGVLGIFSIGIVFLLLAGAAGVAASRSAPTNTLGPEET